MYDVCFERRIVLSEFNLEILMPDKVVLSSLVEKVIVRTIEGDVGILKNHANYISAIDEGPMTVFFADGKIEKAKVKSGLISVLDNKVVILVLSYVKTC